MTRAVLFAVLVFTWIAVGHQAWVLHTEATPALNDFNAALARLDLPAMQIALKKFLVAADWANDPLWLFHSRTKP